MATDIQLFRFLILTKTVGRDCTRLLLAYTAGSLVSHRCIPCEHQSFLPDMTELGDAEEFWPLVVPSHHNEGCIC